MLWEFSWKTGGFNSKGGTVSSESIGAGSKVDEKGRFETGQKLSYPRSTRACLSLQRRRMRRSSSHLKRRQPNTFI